MYTLRTRFAKDIVCEFLPPKRQLKKQKVIILADGMPTVPSKKALLEFFSKKGFWVFHPRYRGSWESDGKFLAKSPHLDILDVIAGIHKPFQSIYHKVSGDKTKIHLKPTQIILVGSSFGGPAVLLNAKDSRVNKVIAISPVIDWEPVFKLRSPGDKLEFIQEAFGKAYNLTRTGWQNLRKPNFYNPITEHKTIPSNKVLVIQSKDDEAVPYKLTKKFTDKAGIKLVTLPRGGHVGASLLLKPRFTKLFLNFINAK